RKIFRPYPPPQHSPLPHRQKRWIKDIDTFVAEGHVWEDVCLVSCGYLRSILEGPPIPEDASQPPE
ncbi:MAG: hypothetical protein ACP5Q1_10830, partial [Anaerolineae bacterium]